MTGGGRGLGRAIALGLAERGDTVVAVARSDDQLAGDPSARGRGRGHARDRSPATWPIMRPWRGCVTRCWSSVGPPAILVNAAGMFGPIALIKDVDPEAWQRTIMVDAVAPFYTCNAFVGGMLEAGWGRIVNITSAASLHPPGALNSAYGTAKAALNQLTRHLAAEIAGSGVTANVIHPGDVKTAMWADIRERVAGMGAVAENYISWADWVEETGGDPPEKAVALTLHLTSDAGGSTNGEFCWIEDPLQAPIPSWDPPVRGATLDEGVSGLRAEDLVGTWQLLEWEAQQEDGTVSRPFGDAPAGYVVYTHDAHMITNISRAGRPAIGGDLLSAPAEARAAAYASFVAYAGSYRVEGHRRHPPRRAEPLSRLGGHRAAAQGPVQCRQGPAHAVDRPHGRVGRAAAQPAALAAREGLNADVTHGGLLPVAVRWSPLRSPAGVPSARPRRRHHRASPSCGG